MVCWGLPVGRGVGHHAPSIRTLLECALLAPPVRPMLGDLDSSIMLSLESHRYLLRTTYSIDAIVGEFAAVLLRNVYRTFLSTTYSEYDVLLGTVPSVRKQQVRKEVVSCLLVPRQVRLSPSAHVGLKARCRR
jgi:hypothetical protein